jgi:hypothetical protein
MKEKEGELYVKTDWLLRHYGGPLIAYIQSQQAARSSPWSANDRRA